MPQLLVRDVPQTVVDALKRGLRTTDEAEHPLILEETPGRGEFWQRGHFAAGTRGRVSGPVGGADPPGPRRAVRIAHHGTHVVTADRRFVFAANIPAHAGSVRLLTA
jgi:hypothetical protein